MSSIQSGEFLRKLIPAAIAAFGFQLPAQAAPVEYVKVCSMYGAGFFYIPGTDTCIRLSGGAQVGFGESNTTFNVNPSFDVRGSGVVYGFNGMALIGVSHSDVAIGARAGYFDGRMGGSAFYAPSGGLYSVDTKGMVFGDVVVQYSPPSWRGVSGRAFAGIADVRSQTEFNVVRSFLVGSDSTTRTGFTAGVGFSAPLPSDNAFSITGEARYVGVTQTFNVPGSVETNHGIFLGTLGAEYSFVAK